ncbi:MAG: Asp-tRNA(Asn)/Glu-tRNA(Gln) amidotransferase subunit GatB [Patescibacteria group bacterium]
MNYELILGLEVHIQPKLNSKMFCRCSAEAFGKEPNTLTCPVCLGLPGALPVPNKKAIEKTQLLGLALNCKLNKYSKFDRKNYFYPDLPKGYQISQYDLPLCENGFLMIKEKKIRIRRVHLEEDTGKSIHEPGRTLLDFNKSGVALIEVVTEPDFRSAEEATLFSKEIQRIVRYMNISDADMEKGQLRLEANISVRNEGDKNYPPYRVEVKNINSFRFFEKAVNYELNRQVEILKSGLMPMQENRGWDDIRGVTRPQREKEEAHDYRYFPEPDIPPMDFDEAYIYALKAKLIELPYQKVLRFIEKYAISAEYAYILTESLQTAELFEQMCKNHNPQLVANTLINKPSTRKLSFREFNALLLENTVEKLTEDETKKLVKEVILTSAKAVEDYKTGKEESLMFLVGSVMKKSLGKADPNVTKRLLESLL